MSKYIFCNCIYIYTGCETEIVCRKSAKILDAGARALQEGLQVRIFMDYNVIYKLCYISTRTYTYICI